MVIVSGSKRSGTSMWMQILVAAGLEPLGRRFSANWEERLSHLNPEGFYESPFRHGLNFTNNPDPQTGQYIDPREETFTAMKVFGSALAMTEFAYLNRVIGTMRDWRSFVASRERLERGDRRGKPKVPSELRLAPTLEWWMANYGMVRDATIRRYPFSWLSYESMVSEEGPMLVEQALRWIDPTRDWNVDAAVSQIRPELRHYALDDLEVQEPWMSAEAEQLFDDLYALAHRGQSVDSSMLIRMDEYHRVVLPYIHEHHERLQALHRPENGE